MLSLISSSLRWFRASRPMLRWIALGYVIKAAAFGVAWSFIPDLPQRLWAAVEAFWAVLCEF